MYVCVVDRDGRKLLHMNIRNNDFEFFLRKIAPWQHDLTVCCECLFNWYWLADACEEAGLKFVLAHALYLKAIHGGKNKNDRIDSEKLAHLLRCNMIPPAYVYPAHKRPIRALLRQRMSYVWQRAEVLQRMAIMQMAEGHEPVPHKNGNREQWLETLLEVHTDPAHRFSLQTNVALVTSYDELIGGLEKELLRITRRDASRNMTILSTVPGIGKTLGQTILYEVDDINRFPTVQRFSSYCRQVKGTVASAGKIKALRGKKLGNPYLAWAFGEAAVLGKRHDKNIAGLAKELEEKHGKHKANAIVGSKICRAVYYMLKNKTAFDIERLAGTLQKAT
jgi:transposase